MKDKYKYKFECKSIIGTIQSVLALSHLVMNSTAAHDSQRAILTAITLILEIVRLSAFGEMVFINTPELRSSGERPVGRMKRSGSGSGDRDTIRGGESKLR